MSSNVSFLSFTNFTWSILEYFVPYGKKKESTKQSEKTNMWKIESHFDISESKVSEKSWNEAGI